MSDSRTEEQVVHETAEVKFYVIGGEVVARSKNGDKLPPALTSNLLLLDIAQSLADIRHWGIAQNHEYGQATWVRS